MESQQYDVSPEMLKLFRRKEKERAANKEYFRNMISNPHRDPHLGAHIDPTIHRYHAMSTYHDEIYKVGAKSYRSAFVVLTPIVLYYLYLSNDRRQKEREMREGRVRYQDRTNKKF